MSRDDIKPVCDFDRNGACSAEPSGAVPGDNILHEVGRASASRRAFIKGVIASGAVGLGRAATCSRGTAAAGARRRRRARSSG